MTEKTTTDKPNQDKGTPLPAQTPKASHGFDPVGSAGKNDGQNGRPGPDPKDKDASQDAKK